MKDFADVNGGERKMYRKWGKRCMAIMMSIMMMCSLVVQPAKAAERENTMVAKEIVSRMTLEEKIGQMIMPAMRKWNGKNVTVLNAELSEAIRKYKFGGIILFAENTPETEQTVRLIDQMQQAASYPLLISIDQEGGTVTRLGQGTNFGGNMALTATGNIQNTIDVSNAIGEELSALGIQIDFAPVVDVNVNPNNPVIGVRSFSDNPDVVANQGAAFISGLHKAGVASALKHFPGHGDTATDSHTGLPCINKTLEQIQQCELIPFKKGIDAGADIVMTAHIQYPMIEKTTYKARDGKVITLPATLSKTMITDVLRGQLGYDGVVTTDALNMDAIAKLFVPKDAARLAINADVDILLMPVDLSSVAGIQNMERYLNDIVNMVSKGEINEATITRSAERIVKLKLDYGVMKADGSASENLLQDENLRIAKALQTVGSPAHKVLEWKVAGEAVTLVKNDNQTLPLCQSTSENIAIFCPYNSEISSIEQAITKLKQDHLLEDTTVCKVFSYEKKNISEVADIIKENDTFVVISEMSGKSTISGWQGNFINALNQEAHSSGRKVIIVSARLPYDAIFYQNADAIVLTYCPKSSAFNISAAIYAIFDKKLPTGQIPLKIVE